MSYRISIFLLLLLMFAQGCASKSVMSLRSLANAEATLEQAQLMISPIAGNQILLKITAAPPISEREVWVLETSTSMAAGTWAPYRIFVGSVQLVVPRRFEKEFFRAVKRPLPAGSARGSIQVSNYSPARHEYDAYGNLVFVPERGTFRVIGAYSIDKAALQYFPSILSVSPPYSPDQKYAPFEVGIVGLNAGNLVTSAQTSFQFQSPLTYSSRAEAQLFLDSIQVFVVPRILSFP